MNKYARMYMEKSLGPHGDDSTEKCGKLTVVLNSAMITMLRFPQPCRLYLFFSVL